MSDNQNPAGQNSSDELPAWARESLTKANHQAAATRVENKELKSQLEEATEKVAQFESQIKALTDEKADLVAKAEVGATELLKLQVTLAAGIPGEHAAEFAGRLKGSTEEELKADAAKIADLFKASSKTPATDPSQGHGNGAPANDPANQFGQMINSMVRR